MGDKREFPYITLIRSHEGGGKKHFEKKITYKNDRADTKKLPGPPSPLI